MQKLTLLFVAVLLASTSFAKIWRVNNNAGVVADFTDVYLAVASASVVAGDTIHIEASATGYLSFTPTKRLVYIGPGYFLDPTDVTYPYNNGLQAVTKSADIGGITFSNSAAAGSKFLGLSLTVYVYGSAASWNLSFEKDRISQLYFYQNGSNLNFDGTFFRKCFFVYGIFMNPNLTVSNIIIENSIFYSSGGNVTLYPTATNNIFRNNSFYNSTSSVTITNAYIANNIFSATSQNTFTSCTLKNNLFAGAQTLPGTATGNQINVNMTNVYVGGSGSLDSRVALKSGSPAIGTGVTISGYTPDCGAFGGPDPYKLSGIPPIPSIYSLTVPTSIPTGTATMNVTFSSRNNN